MSNFDFLKDDFDTKEYYDPAVESEHLYTEQHYGATAVNIRKILENLIKRILDFNYLEVKERASFDSNLHTIKEKRLVPTYILDNLYSLKRFGNESAHTLDSINQKDALEALEKLQIVLVWFAQKYTENEPNPKFEKPEFEATYQSMQKNERKLIYIQTADNSKNEYPTYVGLEKVGDASIPADEMEINTKPNSEDLRTAADKRINQYMKTAGIRHILQWAELAWSKKKGEFFTDKAVHEVLERSNIKKNKITDGNEWFETDLETVKKAIKAVKEGKTSLDVETNDNDVVIKLRSEQQEAINKTKKVFKKKSNKRMLWNAKMRFGKTLSALQLIKDENYQKVLIMTHRPVVSDGWYEDFNKIGMSKEGYKFGSKTRGERNAKTLIDSKNPFIYFASMQDLRGSEEIGGKSGDKNEDIFNTDWDLVIIDEAHEGTQTDLAQNVINAVMKDNTKLLELSGTPFNIADQYNEEDTFTWDYVMEQEAKLRFSVEHPDEKNPYEGLPSVEMYTFEMNAKDKYKTLDSSFNFKEFFSVNDNGKFVHESEVEHFLNNITHESKKTKYPFSTEEFRNNLRHTLWLLPSVKSAKAMKELMENHPIFKEYNIVNAVENGDSDDLAENNKKDLDRVRDAITDKPSQTKTITLTVRKLTTGVNVKEWTGVVFLSNTNSATQYLQAAFRAQTPFSDPILGMKKKSYIFDFAPDRALNMAASITSLNTGAGKPTTAGQNAKMSKLLNFMPVIGMSGNSMKPFNVDDFMTNIKRSYAEKAVRTGFDDDSLYSDTLLLNLDKQDLDKFNDLKALVGTTSKNRKKDKIEVNDNGLTDEEYEVAEKAQKKHKKERTPEEQAAIDKENKIRKQRKTMISILKGVSIRIPLMIYGMSVDIDDDIKIDDFINKVDDKSWKEFMPTGVTKEMFKTFTKYYDNEIFVEAGKIIRRKVKALDKLDPINRSEKLAEIFGTFKNPDKETVLTPWRVVNMQLGKTIGGYSFFDDDYKNTTINGKSANHWINTKITNETFKGDSHILEINSKTGLYPLYVATSLYYQAQKKLNESRAGKFTSRDEDELWQNILSNNIFVIAKTPMAKTITERTLSGYKNYNTNVKFIEDIVSKSKKDLDELVNEIESRFNFMKFDVVVGNPPYSESDNDSGKGSGTPIYNHFMEISKSLNPKFITLITPSVWFTGGKGLEKYRDEMLKDTHIKTIYNFITPKDVFPSTNLRGGVNYFLWDSSYDNSKNNVEITTIDNGKIIEKAIRPLTIPGINILISSNISFNILKKLVDEKSIKLDYESQEMLSYYISSRNPFGFNTNSLKFSNVYSNSTKLFNPIKMYASKGKIGYVERDSIKKNKSWINKIKVLTPFANNISTDLNDDNLNTIISKENTICTETFLVIGADLNLNVDEANNLSNYLKTKFVRFLISLAKANQNGTRQTYRFVPMQNFSHDSDINWNENIDIIDEQLFEKYHLNKKEQDFIKSNIKRSN